MSIKLSKMQSHLDHSKSFVLHPLIHTRLGFTLVQDIENTLHKIYAVVNEGEGEGKKIPHSRMLREWGSKRRHEEKASL